MPEPSDTLYPMAPQPPVICGGGNGSGSSRSSSSRRRVPSPIGSPSLIASEQDEYGRFVCKYAECDAKPQDRIFTRKSDWRYVSPHPRVIDDMRSSVPSADVVLAT